LSTNSLYETASATPPVFAGFVHRRELLKKRLLSSASQVFDEKPKKRDLERERADREMSRMKDVIAEITAENVELKKRFRPSPTSAPPAPSSAYFWGFFGGGDEQICRVLGGFDGCAGPR
jgi:hypothetical protein